MELLEVLKGLAGGAAVALDAPLELGEGFAAVGSGLTRGGTSGRDGSFPGGRRPRFEFRRRAGGA